MSNENSSKKLYEKLNETITSLINCWNPNHSSDFNKEHYEKIKNKHFIEIDNLFKNNQNDCWQ